MLETLRTELERVYGRIEQNNDATSNVIQYIILVFGASLIAAVEYLAAFAAVPIFWTVWMLHSRIIDFNTLKLSMYAAELERKLNKNLSEPVFFWESRYTQRGNVRPIMFDLNFGYWGLLNAASWVGGIVALIYAQFYVASTALACLWVTLWGPFIRDVISRDAVMTALRVEMAKSPRRKPVPITVPSDSIRTHVPVLVLGVLAVAWSMFIQFGMAEPGAQWVAGGYNLALVLSLGALDLVRGGPGSIRKSART